MNRKRICKVAGILLVFLLCVTYLTDILTMKWKYPCYESVIPDRFYDVEKNTVEVCVLGSSQVVYGISGMELYGDYGISAYSLGTALQPMQASYSWLKECRKTQDIRLVVLDMSMLYEYSDEARYRQAYDNMKLSVDKLRELYWHCQSRENSDPFLSYIFKIIKYHTRWNVLDEDDFTILSQDHPIFRGNYAYAVNEKVSLDKIAYDNDEENPDLTMYPEQLEYFKKIAGYCEDNDIELLLIKTPKSDWSLTKHLQTEELAQEMGLDFIDFSSLEMIETLGLDVDLDFRDNEHLNLRGAVKLSRYLGQYIKDHYELTDFRQMEGYDDQNYARYCQRLEDSDLQLGRDISEYFSNLNKDRYEVLIQLTAKASAFCTDELNTALKSTGLTVDLSGLKNQHYTALLKGGQVLYENVSPDDIEYSAYFEDGVVFSAFSNFSTSTASKILVDYETEKFTRKGLNILVYDVENHTVVDRSTVYYDETSQETVIGKDNSQVYNAR